MNNRIIILYQSPHDLKNQRTPAEAGRAEEVVRYVANLVQKGIVGAIFFRSSHVLYKKGKGYTYEVKLIKDGKTIKRRFTVYRLGGSHAKSECYQVTDPHGEYMFVKIPPKAITDFNTYLKAIAHERDLAKKLLELGIKVVVPCVSTVMKHLYKFDSRNHFSPNEMEDAYFEILKTSGNRFVEQFKIGGEYAFFMEFLDDPFLGKVVREFYNKDTQLKTKKEYFKRDFYLLHTHNRQAFICEYKHIGSEKYLTALYRGLRETYEKYSDRVHAILNPYAISIDMWKIKDWFIGSTFKDLIDESSFLEFEDLNYGDKEIFFNRLNRLLIEIIDTSAPLKQYLDILDQVVNWYTFKHNSAKMKNIGDNLLILLSKLEKMGLVLRDLKVDNLFISDNENLDLGVIDLETGGYIGAGKIEGILPAGMPSNMTLSNLIFDRQLKRIYGKDSLAKILHMQDWYATLAMMFETNTGSTLFVQAREYILKINREINEKLAVNYNAFIRENPGVKVTSEMIENSFGLSDEEIMEKTYHFIGLAKQDLHQKSLEHLLKLKEIQYTIPDEIKKSFLEDIENDLQQIQDGFLNYKLSAVSIEYLNRDTTTVKILRKNLTLKEQLYRSKKNNPSPHNQAKLPKLLKEIQVYKACIQLKQQQLQLQEKRLLLKQDQIAAVDLFNIMLQFIAKAMCREEWAQYRQKVSKKKPNRHLQQDIVDENWIATIIPTKEELTQETC